MEDNANTGATTRTFVTLRIIGKLLDPVDVTSTLRLEPSEAKRAGDPRGRSGHWPHGYWELSSKEHVVSTDLATHLVWLIDMIEPSAPALRQLQATGFMTDIFGFWETSLAQGGITLGPELLHRVGSLDLAIEIDIYFAS